MAPRRQAQHHVRANINGTNNAPAFVNWDVVRIRNESDTQYLIEWARYPLTDDEFVRWDDEYHHHGWVRLADGTLYPFWNHTWELKEGVSDAAVAQWVANQGG